ncbi:hypothetical protein CH063_09151, partial [Colletotrichum higginsianum]
PAALLVLRSNFAHLSTLRSNRRSRHSSPIPGKLKLCSLVTTTKRQYGLIPASYLAARSLHQAVATAISNHQSPVTLPNAQIASPPPRFPPLPCPSVSSGVALSAPSHPTSQPTPAYHSVTPHVLLALPVDSQQQRGPAVFEEKTSPETSDQAAINVPTAKITRQVSSSCLPPTGDRLYPPIHAFKHCLDVPALPCHA